MLLYSGSFWGLVCRDNNNSSIKGSFNASEKTIFPFDGDGAPINCSMWISSRCLSYASGIKYSPRGIKLLCSNAGYCPKICMAMNPFPTPNMSPILAQYFLLSWLVEPLTHYLIEIADPF